MDSKISNCIRKEQPSRGGSPAERDDNMDKEELTKVLENHRHWLSEDCEGWENMRANLRGANLYGAKMPFIPYACPDFGAFIGYKKAYGDAIVELEILASAKRCSATSRKCRCDKAKVLRILNLDKTVSDATEVRSKYDESFIYKVGEVVSVDDFCDDRWNECSAGIHFFINFEEAARY